jgi:UDP-glucose 4-epimerase
MGFMGYPLALRLAEFGHEVVGVDRHIDVGTDATTQGVSWVESEIDEFTNLVTILKPNDFVYAFTGGAIPDPGRNRPREQLDQTVGALLSLLEACRERRIGRLVYPSSGGTVYGRHRYLPIDEHHPTDPLSAYGVQKLAAEKYLAVYNRLYDLDSFVLRIGNPYGPRQDPHKGQGLIAAFIYKALTGRPVEIWGDGESIRDYLYIDDVVDAIISVSYYPGKERIFNIGSGEGRSVNAIVRSLQDILGINAAEISWRPARAFDAPANVLDAALARRELGWRVTTPLEEGLRRQIEWIRDNVVAPELEGHQYER